MRQPEEIKREFVHQWLLKADADLSAARHLLTGGALLSFGAAFHAQQAIEKLLKAVLVWYQVEFPKTHDISRILNLVRSADAALADRVSDAVSLNPYGVEVRYPGDAPEPTQEEAREAVAVAERVHRAVFEHLPAEFRSSAG